MDQLSVAAYIRLQLQKTKDESRGTTQTCTARSNERSLRIGRARVVKVRKIFQPNSASANNRKGGMATQGDNSQHFQGPDEGVF